jgi:hypothetical protein
MSDSQSVVIEKGIPLPPRSTRRDTQDPYRLDTLRKMEAGDSFFVIDGHEFPRWASVCASKAARKLGRWTTRKVAGGWRVWRVE